jgi:aldehyde dehydrogenase (NAD(P)+)
VWGDDDAELGRREDRPLFDAPLTSELGNVSPVLVVPGSYEEAELEHLVGETVAMLTNNASFNCAAGKVLVVADGWHQKESFIRRLTAALRTVPTRRAYHPGARERWTALTAGRSLERIGRETADRLPWTLIRGLDPSSADEPLFSTEAFCPVLGIVELDVPNAVEFVERAARFANDRLWGTLNACWFVDKEQRSLRPVREALDRANADLRYGTVAINCWPALSFGLVSTAWGGHPSSSRADIQSGLGFVHDTFMLEGVEKTVLRSPMPPFPKPVWFADHGHAADVGRRLVEMEKSPSWLKVPRLAFSALLG